MQPSKPTVPNQANATPATAQPAGKKPNPRRMPALVGAALTMLLVCALTLWAVTRPEQPRLNDDTVSIVKYVCTDDYAKLSFPRQAEYMKVLEDRDDNDELETAFEAGQLTESEYRAALMEAWLGQQVKRSEKYASLPPGAAREKYIRDLLNKKEKKKAAKGNKRQPEGADTEVKRDKAMEDIRINAWPAEARTRWQDYRRAYDAQKEAREAAAAPGDASGAN
jgi:hypothetical protein